MFIETFRTKLNIHDGTFFTSVKPYSVKPYSIRLNCLLGSIFYTTREKTCNCWNFFFQHSKLCNGVKSSIMKDFFLYWEYYGQNIYEKWKIKNFVVLDLPHALKLFESNKMCFFLHVSNVSGVCKGMHVWSHVSYAEVWVSDP